VIATSPRYALVSVILIGALGLTEGVSLLLLLPLLHLVGINDPAATSTVTEWFQTMFRLVGVSPTLGSVLIAFVGLAASRAALLRAQAWVNASLRENVTSSLRVRLYSAIALADWSFLIARRPSELVNVVANEVSRVGSAGFQVLNLAGGVAVSLVYFGTAFHFSPAMTLLALASVALLAWSARGRLRQARALGARAAKIRKMLHISITEHLGSIKTARSYGVAQQHVGTLTRLSRELRDVNLEAVADESRLQQHLELGSTTLLAGIVYVSFELLDITAAQLLVLLFVFARLIPRSITIYRQLQGLAGVSPVLDSVARLERECIDAAEIASLEREDVSLVSGVRFEDVSFSYPCHGSPAVLDLDLDIPAGLTTAIVGPSGAGKSTVADLLVGLLSPTRGRILSDGLPLGARRLAAWRRHIGYVAQDTFLFHDSVRANLVWTRPNATDDDLWRALRLAAAEEFVARLPQGLDTVVGERGVMLSGGERQRVSLARALLRRPHLLILDEATSSLDTQNELQIQRAIESLHHLMTIVVITHRLSTIRHADVIHVLDGGRVVETGSWATLMSNSHGLFRRMCDAQDLAAHRSLDAVVVSAS
jgi:ATP-binding cassette subfamily C protein